jgi:Na+/proline symporter
LILLLLSWKKVTHQGVLAGLATGFITTVIWSELSALDAVISVRFVSWVMAFLAVWLVSRVTQTHS